VGDASATRAEGAGWLSCYALQQVLHECSAPYTVCACVHLVLGAYVVSPWFCHTGRRPAAVVLLTLLATTMTGD
jgi:hypothetical protein